MLKQMKMIMGVLLSSVMLLGALVLPTTSFAADRSKVVIQVSQGDPSVWNLALSNAKNIQKDLGKDNVDLEIVAFGPGISMLKAQSEVADRVSQAVAAGVQVVACENTMHAMKLDKADMNPAIGYVPSGAVEIMRRQQQGYAYLRP